MPRSHSSHNTANLIILSMIVGLVSAVAIIIALTSLGLQRMEAAVFAILSGFTIGAFVYRERSLTESFKDFRIEKNDQLVRYEKQIEYYYSRSLVCLVYFDAGSLLIDRTSPGFLQLLRIPPELNVRGKSVVDLLHVTPSSIESLVSEAQHNTQVQKPHHLKVQDYVGNGLPVEVTMEYYRDKHMVEAAFFANPDAPVEDSEEVDVSSKDLDRFRRGMYRRETRIIELKEEINEILKESGKEPRYGFDHRTKTSNFPSSKYPDNEESH